MKILLVLPNLPYPLDSGGNQAMFTMISALCRKHDVSIITATRSYSSWERTRDKLQAFWPDVKFYRSDISKHWCFPCSDVNPGLKFKFVRRKAESFCRKYFRIQTRHNLRSLDASSMVMLRSTMNEFPMDPTYHTLYQNICELHQKERFDIIQAEFTNFLNMAYYLPDDVRKVFVHHELAFVRRRCELDLMQQSDIRLEALWQMQKNAEIAALRQYDDVIVLTDVDKDILIKEGLEPQKIYVSGALVQTREMEFKPCSGEFVFVGGYWHHPNFDGLLWLKEEVIPILRQRGFTPVIHVVGAWRRHAVRKLHAGEPSLIFEGFVDDLPGYLNGKISLVPIRIGSGMRMKILDAVSAGSPFITTSKGVEGQGFRHGQDCIICDDPAEFADWMIRLASDTQLCQSLATSSKKLMAETYIPANIIERRMSFYE